MPDYEDQYESVWSLTGSVLGARHYLVLSKNHGELFAVDSGFGKSLLPDLVKAIRRPIRAVYVTHGHFDHIGGADFLSRELGCPVVVSRLDRRTIGGSNFLVKVFGHPGPIDLPELTFVDSNYFDELVTFLPCPGHTPGSVLIRTKSSIFTGDSIYSRGVDLVKLPQQDDELLRHSILSNLESVTSARMLFPGHGEGIAGNRLFESNPELREFLQTRNSTLG